jgi:hypothetical protein
VTDPVTVPGVTGSTPSPVTCAATLEQIPSLSFLNIGIKGVMSSGPGGIVQKITRVYRV